MEGKATVEPLSGWTLVRADDDIDMLSVFKKDFCGGSV